MDFSLHPRLEADSLGVLSLAQCDIRLVNDSRYLWLLAIPRVANIVEWHDLPADIGRAIFDETRLVSLWAKDYARADKMNIATLGNQVAQLHIHIIARHKTDAAWPNPVWGVGQASAYDDESRDKILHDCRSGLSG